MKIKRQYLFISIEKHNKLFDAFNSNFQIINLFENDFIVSNIKYRFIPFDDSFQDGLFLVFPNDYKKKTAIFNLNISYVDNQEQFITFKQCTSIA